MSDFDENWQLKGTPDPATPDVQPNQIRMQQAAPAAQPAAQPAVQQPYAQPVQPMSQPVQPVSQQPYAQPVTPVMQQPVAQPIQQPVQQAYQQVYGGYAYPGQPVGYQQAGMQLDYAAMTAKRDESLAECQRLLNHFSPKIDVFQKYENCWANIEKFTKTSVAPLIWGILVALFGIISIVTTILETKSKHNLVPYLIVGGVIVLIGAGLIVLFVMKKKSHAAKKQKNIEEAIDLSNQLTLLYNGYGNCILPPEYIDPRIVYKLQAIIMSGSALTIPDALNLILMYQRVYSKIESEKARALQVSSEWFDGKPAFFNAVKYLNLR